ncbi:MAG: glycosyltransferase [Thiohalocapsa sp.]|nr:glycosyltransferase [Thiohalocapsa sp.]
MSLPDEAVLTFLEPGYRIPMRYVSDVVARSNRRCIEHVIVVNDHASINGGQTRIAIESALELVRSGLRVTFFAACGPVDPRLYEAGIEVLCLQQHDILTDPSRLRAVTQGLWNLKAARRLRALLDAQNPATTILHCHGYAKALSPSIGRVLTTSAVPHVFTVHEYFLTCPNGGYYDYQAQAICKRRPLSGPCMLRNCDVRHPLHKAWRVVRQLILWRFGKMPRRLRHIIYISEVQRRVMRSHLPSGASLHYLPNPISVSTTKRVRAEDNQLFLFVGRLSREKGAVLFAAAARRLGIGCVFVGDGPERDAVSAANPDAIVTGWVKPHEVDAWLDQARCLVFPSVWYETFGLVAYEALSRGVPVVCGAWSAAAEAITEGVNGALFNQPTVSSLTNALSQLNAIPDFRQVSESALTRARRESMNLNEHVTKLRQLYSTVGSRH